MNAKIKKAMQSNFFCCLEVYAIYNIVFSVFVSLAKSRRAIVTSIASFSRR